jgi:hypothetical protein
MLNCKAGELAYVIRDFKFRNLCGKKFPIKQGTIVRVIELYPSFKDLETMNVWKIESPVNTTRECEGKTCGRPVFFIKDKHLRPLKDVPPEAVDETLIWKPITIVRKEDISSPA